MASAKLTFVTTLCDHGPDNIQGCLHSNYNCTPFGWGATSGKQCYCCNLLTCPHWKNYSARELMQMTYASPIAAGCTSWDACDFAFVPGTDKTSPPDGFACNETYPSIQTVQVKKTSFDPAVARFCCLASNSSTMNQIVVQGTTLTRELVCDPAWMPLTRFCDNTLFPPLPCGNADSRNEKAPLDNRAACCFGSVSDANLSQCRTGWCPGDPYGSCTDLFLDACVQADESCGRNKLLGDKVCNDWYIATQDIGHPSFPIVQNAVSAWCDTDGYGYGECACRNARERLLGISATGQTPVFGIDGNHPTKPTVRRVDLYCVSGGATTKIDPSNPYSSPCVGNKGATTTDASPVTPLPGNLEWLPTHCWLGDCQPNSTTCRFSSPQEDILPCPNICAQISSGNRINIGGGAGGLDASNVIMIDNLFEDCNFADGAQTMTDGYPVFSLWGPGQTIPTYELEFCVAPGDKVDVPLTLVNNAMDKHWAEMASVPYTVRTSFNGLASISYNGDGTLTSGGQVPLSLTLDTTGMTDYLAQYRGELVVLDTTGANDPLQVVTVVNMVPASEVAGNGQCASTTKSVRRLQAAAPPGNETRSESVGWQFWIIVVLAVVLGVTLLGVGIWKTAQRRETFVKNPAVGAIELASKIQ